MTAEIAINSSESVCQSIQGQGAATGAGDSPASCGQAAVADRTSPAHRSPRFSRDWFSAHVPLWNAVLERYKGQPNLRFLEIGSFEGLSTVWLLENVLTHETSSIVCMDTFSGSAEHKEGEPYCMTENELAGLLETFKHNVQPYARRVDVRVGFSQDLLRQIEPVEQFDFIYVDGSHEAPDVLEDGILSFRMLKRGGLMIFDDYTWDLYPEAVKNPRLGVDAFLAVFAGKYQLISQGYQVAIEKK